MGSQPDAILKQLKACLQGQAFLFQGRNQTVKNWEVNCKGKCKYGEKGKDRIRKGKKGRKKIKKEGKKSKKSVKITIETR